VRTIRIASFGTKYHNASVTEPNNEDNDDNDLWQFVSLSETSLTTNMPFSTAGNSEAKPIKHLHPPPPHHHHRHQHCSVLQSTKAYITSSKPMWLKSLAKCGHTPVRRLSISGLLRSGGVAASRNYMYICASMSKTAARSIMP